MATTSEGMSQRLARLRSGSRIATVQPVCRAELMPSESEKIPVDDCRCSWCGERHNGGPEFCDLQLFVCLESLSLRQFDDRIEPSAGYRIHNRQVWLEVTPQLLGWMSDRIQRGLTQRVVSEDLGAAINLFHSARDASGLEPASVTPAFVPPGVGLEAPIGWETQRRNAWERFGGIGVVGDGSRRRVTNPTFPIGSFVQSRAGPISTAAGDVGGVMQVVAVNCDDLGEWVDLGRDGRELVCGVSVSVLDFAASR